MKRPPGIWILLSAGVLWLSLQDAYGIRATELIFGKSTTTTTTTEGTVAQSSDENATEVSTEISNATKHNLTGIPQIDYVWDPNLPKELNGYNLSDYPFYERVPEDITFKCDGLHDGFYASVPHKCQVYHHCLFGTRYDFLCGNFTAFDQKTFICHFVSEIDCVNSKKYWSRNDALYTAATTTTIRPLIQYTPPPEPHPALAAAGPGQSKTRRPASRRRPVRRRRPQYEYYDDEEEYDDYYDERPRSRRKRPRPRPRPVYEDEYEEYEDERYERRGSGRRDEDRNRKTYERRPERRRNKDRAKYEDEEEDERVEDDRKSDTRSRYNKRRPDDDSEESERKRSRPKGARRPIEDDYEEEEEKANEGDKIKPTSGSSIYDRPRTAPRINRPVPKNEASKYAYKPIVTKAPPVEEEEEYDDYEEAPKRSRKGEESRRQPARREEEKETRKTSASRIRPQASKEDSYEDEPPRRPKYGSIQRDRPRVKKPQPPEEYDDYEEKVKTESFEKRKEKPTTTTTTQKPKTTTTTTTTPEPVEDIFKPEAIVRIVKRPFLPSRGGNPYSSRGLQPVGNKAVDKKPEEQTTPAGEILETKPAFKPSPMFIKMPSRQKYQTPAEPVQEEFKPVSNRPQTPPRPSMKPSKDYSGPRTTQKPKSLDHDPLDIEEDEYDVTLNDALNPTLPNLPVRGYPTGFSNTNDYSYNTFQRPRYVGEENNSNYYQAKPVRQRFEAVPYNSNPQEQFVNSDAEYKGQYSTITRESYRPRITQAFYSRY